MQLDGVRGESDGGVRGGTTHGRRRHVRGCPQPGSVRAPPQRGVKGEKGGNEGPGDERRARGGGGGARVGGGGK